MISSNDIPYVADHLPQKQGLRHSSLGVNVTNKILVADHLPQKQGLRHLPYLLATTATATVADHLPQKQGSFQLRVKSYELRVGGCYGPR